MRIRQLLFLAALLAVVPAAFGTDVERHYCTQFGPFYLRFDDEKAAGVFNIFSNNDMGAVVGKLEGHVVIGEWIELDNHGSIRIKFAKDWSSFDAEYTVAEDPDNWLTGWRGLLRPENKPKTFIADSVEYFCERTP